MAPIVSNAGTQSWLTLSQGGTQLNTLAYQSPTTLAEAVALLNATDKRARPIAGGTDAVVQLRSGRLQAEVLVDIKRIPELNELSFDPAKGLTIGAAVPCARINANADVQAHYPALWESASIIGSRAIRNRATFGGNLCNAAPSADSVPSMIVHYGECEVIGPESTRTVPVEAFNVALGQTVLQPGELLVAIRFPVPPAHTGSAYEHFTPRHEMDIAVCGCGTSVTLSADGKTIEVARMALATVAPMTLLVTEVSEQLVGKPVSDETIALAAELARAAARPRDTWRGSAAQRRHLVGVLAERTLRKAVARAQGEV